MNRLIRRGLLATVLIATSVVAQAAGVSNYLENKLADHLFRATPYTAPATLCAALLTAAPTDASTGATVVEAAYTGYARAQLNPSVSNWKGTGDEVSGASAGTSGTVKNAVLMTFGTGPSTGPTVVSYVALLDSCTVGAGNLLLYAPLGANKTLNPGDPAPSFSIDAHQWQIDN